MGERSAKEQAAAAAMLEAADALTMAASSFKFAASDINRGGRAHTPTSARDRLAAVAERFVVAQGALAEWARTQDKAEGVHVDGYDRLTHGHRWHVVRDGVEVARGWAPMQDEAAAAAKAAWGQGDEEA